MPQNSDKSNGKPEKKQKHIYPSLHGKAPTRARKTSKIPAVLPTPDGSLCHLTKKMRGIMRRLPVADTMTDIADEMNCSEALVRQTFKLPAVQMYLRQQLEAAGVTHGLLMSRIREGLDATQRKDSFDKAGRLLKGEERPDYTERREHTKLALRLQGLDATPDKDEAGAVTHQSIYNIVLNARAARGIETPPPSIPEAEVINNPPQNDTTPPAEAKNDIPNK